MKNRAFKHWSATEQRTLISSLGEQPIAVTARRLGRTPGALDQRLKQLSIAPTHRIKQAWLTVTQVAGIMGVHRSIPGRWHRAGVLPFVEMYQRSQAVYVIRESVLHQCILDGALIDYTTYPPTSFWQAIVDEGRRRWCERHIDTPELADLLCINRTVISPKQWIGRHGFPSPVRASRGGRVSWYDRAAVRAWLDAHPRYWTRAARERL